MAVMLLEHEFQQLTRGNVVKQAGTNPVTNTSNLSRNSITQAVTVDSGTDTILIFVGVLETAAASFTGVTYGGVALTRVMRKNPTTWGSSEVWYLKSPTPGTANIVASVSASVLCACGIYRYDGVDQDVPFNPVTFAISDSATSSSITVPGHISESLLLDILSLDSTGHNVVVGANQTEEFDFEISAGATTAVSSTQSGADGGVMSHTWTTAAPYSHIAVGLRPSVATAGINVDLTPATETGSAQALTKQKLKTLGVVTETDTAQALVKRKLRAVGVVSETDTAQAITFFKRKTLGVVTETDSPQALVRQKFYTLTPATETGTAQAISVTQGDPVITVDLTPATETSAAQSLVRVKRLVIVPAASVEETRGLTRVKLKTLPIALETGSLVPLIRTKNLTLDLVEETDEVQALAGTVKTLSLTRVLETGIAVALTIQGQEVVIVYRQRGPIVIGRF